CLLPLVYVLVRKGALPILLAGSVLAASVVPWEIGPWSVVAFGPCFLAGIVAYRLGWSRKPLPAIAFPPIIAGTIVGYVLHPGMPYAWFGAGVVGIAIGLSRQLPESW